MSHSGRTLPERLQQAGGWSTAQVTRLRTALHLSGTGMALLGVAVVLIAFLTVVLSAVSEDVITVDGLERSDLTRLQFVADHRGDWMLALAALFSRLGSFPVLAVAAVVVGLLLWRRGERLFVAMTPLAALLAAGAVVALGKHLVDRTRPPWGLRVIAETDPSFPSGHSGDSAALLLTAALVIAAVTLAGHWNRVLLVLVAGLFVACIGVSRMILGVHYLTDVLAGWALGAIVALGLTTATLLVRHRLESTGAPGPQADRAPILRVLLADRRTWRSSFWSRPTSA